MSPGDLSLLRKVPKKKALPGMETKSIRKTQADMNMGNGMAVQRVKPGTLICYRCGEKDHLLKNCPLHYQPTFAFAPKEDTLVSDTLAVEERDDTGEETSDQLVPVNITDASESDSPPDLINLVNTPPTENEEELHEDRSEDLRLASWISPTTESILVCESYISEIYQTLDTKTETAQPNLLPIIIGSGASSTVCGLSWIRALSKIMGCEVPDFRVQSGKVFRFGNNMTYRSLEILYLEICAKLEEKR